MPAPDSLSVPLDAAGRTARAEVVRGPREKDGRWYWRVREEHQGERRDVSAAVLTGGRWLTAAEAHRALILHAAQASPAPTARLRTLGEVLGAWVAAVRTWRDLAPVEGVDLEEVLRWVAVRADVLAVPRHAWTCGQRCDSEDLAERLAGVVPALAREVERLRAAVRFADEQGAEAIERVSSAIVADKWSATAAFQERALKAEAEVARLRAALEETRLTLAAEQGKPEGAPSDGWEFDGRDWSKNYTDGSFAGLSGRRGKRRWMRALWPDTERVPTYLGRGHDVETDRAAMLAADSATEAR